MCKLLKAAILIILFLLSYENSGNAISHKFKTVNHTPFGLTVSYRVSEHDGKTYQKTIGSGASYTHTSHGACLESAQFCIEGKDRPCTHRTTSWQGIPECKSFTFNIYLSSDNTLYIK